jgi:hypothetical protein
MKRTIRVAAARLAAAVAAAVVVAGSAGLAVPGPVSADSSTGGGPTVQVGDAAEAWYTSLAVDTCASPMGCPPLPSPTAPAYPANTLHVAESVGQAMDSLYIQPDLAGVPSGQAPVSGKVVLPLDSDPASGSANPATATIDACLVTSPFPDGAAGSTDSPPPADCRVSAPVIAGTTSFSLDLTPFLQAWNRGQPEYGLALLPTVPSSDPAPTWHVAFNGRNLAGVPHISSTLVLAGTGPPASGFGGPPVTSSPTPSSVPASAPTSLDPGLATAPVIAPPNLGPVATPRGPDLAGPVSPTTSTTADLPAQPAAEVSGPHGFQYPEVLLLPLLFVAGLVFVTRLLTSDPTPKRPRKPA